MSKSSNHLHRVFLYNGIRGFVLGSGKSAPTVTSPIPAILPVALQPPFQSEYSHQCFERMRKTEWGVGLAMSVGHMAYYKNNDNASSEEPFSHPITGSLLALTLGLRPCCQACAHCDRYLGTHF